MAKRRIAVRRASRRSFRNRAIGTYRRSRKNPNSELNQLLGTALFAFVEPTIDSTLQGAAQKMNLNIPTNLMELGVGFAFKKKQGVIGHAARAMYAVNMYQVIKGVVGNGFNLSNVFGGTASSSSNQPNITGF